MPIYEYCCQDCAHKFDALQKMSDAPLESCPDCGKPSLVKLVSAPSFRLSGSGWYETDFKTDKDRKRNLVDSGSSGSDAKSGDSTPDSGNSGADKAKPAADTSSSPAPAVSN